MKKIILQGIVLIIVVTAVWVAGERYGSQKEVPVATPVQAMPTKPPTSPSVVRQPSPLMAPNQWSQYVSARKTAMTADPHLETEYKGILKKMDAQQAKLDAAMLKVDPKIKPVIDKLVALRQQNTSPLDRKTGDKPAPITSSIKLTPEDFQELRVARAQALRSNPDLVANAKAIADQMHAFETKLDAVMIKADPNISPLVAKFENKPQPAVSTQAHSSGQPIIPATK